MSPEHTSPASPVAPGVAFEVERFEWTSRDRLELVGRWFGLRGHRFLRPTLDVQVDGERRRMLAVLEHKPWAPEEGEDWVAAFTWRGDPANFEDAELTVSPELAVQLPAPGGSVETGDAKAATPPADRRPARRPRTAVLEAELAAALAEVDRLGEDLVRGREAHSEAAKELRDRLRGEHTKIRALEAELEQARAQIAAAEAAAAEAADGLRQERDAAAAERDAAFDARDEALATAEAALGERDEALQKLSAAESESDALTEARDRARQERNAWMSRARAAKAGRPSVAPTRVSDRAPAPDAAPAPDPVPHPGAAERRTIQIGERPGSATPAPPVSPVQDRGSESFLGAWAPRLVAALALAVFVVIVIVLLALAL